MSGSIAAAYVLGDVDLVVPLGRAGIPVVLVSGSDEPARRSRHVRRWVPAVDHWTQPDLLVDRLLQAAGGESPRPVLFVQTDGDLLAVSRRRERLGHAFALPLADADLVEDLVDKARFARLCERLDLPVPPTQVLLPESDEDVRLEPPLVVKPTTRAGLVRLGEAAKAVPVDTAQQLAQVRVRLRAAGVTAVAQERIEGSEQRVESWHGYVDGRGELVAAFTGVKVRTWPAQHGHSTVLATTDADDVRRASEDVVRRIGLTGVAKLDWKRDPDGRLHLLEVNPRFTLWQHLGAVAGVDLAALVHADCTGRARPPVRPAPPGLVWCDPVRDLRAVLARELPAPAWVRTVLTCDARSGAAGLDVGPLIARVALHRRRSS